MKFKIIITNIYAIFLMSCVYVPIEEKGVISNFISDKCSNFIEGTQADREAWCHCCVEHDLNYWMGGNKVSRKKADLEFKECIVDTGHPVWATWMWLGVRIGGSAYYSTKYRWGYGWSYRRGYRTLSEVDANRLEYERKNLRAYTKMYCSNNKME